MSTQAYFSLPDFCDEYSFTLHLEGAAGTKPVDLEVGFLGPANLEEEGSLEHLPEVEDLTVNPRMENAMISWIQPACLPDYQMVLFKLEDCSNENKFLECFLDVPPSEAEVTRFSEANIIFSSTR